MGVTVYLLIQTRHGKSMIVHSALSKFEEIREIHEIYGRFDLIAKVETETQDELQHFIQNKFRITEHIRYAETLVAVDGAEEELKET